MSSMILQVNTNTLISHLTRCLLKSQPKLTWLMLWEAPNTGNFSICLDGWCVYVRVSATFKTKSFAFLLSDWGIFAAQNAFQATIKLVNENYSWDLQCHFQMCFKDFRRRLFFKKKSFFVRVDFFYLRLRRSLQNNRTFFVGFCYFLHIYLI